MSWHFQSPSILLVNQRIHANIKDMLCITGSWHYTDVTMSPMASQITSLGIVYSTVYSGADQRKHQSSASLAFVRRIHRGPVNSPHKRPQTRKFFSFDDVIMDGVRWGWDPSITSQSRKRPVMQKVPPWGNVVMCQPTDWVANSIKNFRSVTLTTHKFYRSGWLISTCILKINPNRPISKKLGLW